VIRLRLWRWEDYAAFSRWVQFNHQVLIMETGRQKGQKWRWMYGHASRNAGSWKLEETRKAILSLGF
jgi:hypothetical protein